MPNPTDMCIFKNKYRLLLLLIVANCSLLQAQVITTIAGIRDTPGYAGDGATGTSARLNHPWGIAADDQGNVYIADVVNQVIRKINTAGIISTIAGTGKAGFSGDGGPAVNAELNYPTHVAVDKAGNIYVSDRENSRIRKIDAAGTITTIAGTGTPGYSSDGGPAVFAQLSFNTGDLAVDVSGNIYLAEIGRLRKINSAGIITTIAGNGVPNFSGDGGPAISAEIQISGIAVDRAGSIYIADAGNARVRKINSAGIITTIAGDGTHDYSGDGGAATAAHVDDPYDVAVDHAGNLYIAHHQNHIIRMVNPAGTITTFAGNGTKGYSGDGGPAHLAQLTWPVGVAVDSGGNLYITDTYSHTIRKVNNCVLSSILEQPRDQTICSGGNAIFKINASDVNSYQWQVNHGNGWVDSNDDARYNGSTTKTLTVRDVAASMNGYRFRCIVKNNCGGGSSLEAGLFVSAPAIPSISISIPAGEICMGTNQTFTAATQNLSASHVYQWKKNGIHVGLDQATYSDHNLLTGDRVSCTLVFSNGCVTNQTVASNVIMIKAKECIMGFFIPTAFTPNGDGKNDLFKPLIDEELRSYRFTIYNKWGETVFTSNNIRKGWDGTFRGRKQDTNAFVWTCSYQLAGKEKKNEKGSFLLIR